jgi:hypothetical protein
VRRGPDVPIDLRDPGTVPWAMLEVPDGWVAVARLTEQVATHLDPLVERVVIAIFEEVAAYRTGLVPREDVEASIRRSLGAILVGLAEHRGPTQDELAIRRELGTRRALQGIAIDALIEAFHIGYRELWLALVEAVPPDDPDASLQLLTAATTVWQWVHALTDALTSAHATTVRSLEARAIASRQRFVELLVNGDLDGSEALRLGTALGFDPGGAFVVTVVRGATDDLDAVELQRAVAELPGRHAAVARGPLLVVVTQETRPGEGRDAATEPPTEVVPPRAGPRPDAAAAETDVSAASRRVVPEAGIGIGVGRTGLHGARASLKDAEEALSITSGAVTTRFDDVWLWASLARVGERLEPVLAPGVRVAATNPHLAEAVQAFADAGFSLTEASRRLALHANTVAYRLDRWEELTGWDPKTFAGLVRSVGSLRRVGPLRTDPSGPTAGDRPLP